MQLNMISNGDMVSVPIYCGTDQIAYVWTLCQWLWTGKRDQRSMARLEDLLNGVPPVCITARDQELHQSRQSLARFNFIVIPKTINRKGVIFPSNTTQPIL